MTHTHTPAPWWRDDDGFIASGSDKTYITVASPNCSEDIDIDEREANARLIAAAPEMLAALIAIKTQADFSANTFPNAPGRGDFLAIARWAEAAIAKAKA